MTSETAAAPSEHEQFTTWRDSRSPYYEPKRLGLPLREEIIVQVGSGEFAVDAKMASFEGIGLLSVGVGVESVGITVLNPDYIAFALPVRWAGEYIVNGEAASASDLYMPGDLDSFHLRSKSRVTQGVTIPRQAFIETIAALRGVGVEDVKLNDRKLLMRPAVGALLRVRLAAILDGVCREGRQCTPREVSEEVMGLMVDAYLSARPELEAQTQRGKRPDRIVRLSEERFMAAAGEPVSLADLCAAAGVSKSTLYPAFHRVCGESPLAYFHKRRLTQARSILISSEPQRGQVKQAALSVGLTELGRFAVEYRRLFGESPSATLNRSMV